MSTENELFEIGHVYRWGGYRCSFEITRKITLKEFRQNDLFIYHCIKPGYTIYECIYENTERGYIIDKKGNSIDCWCADSGFVYGTIPIINIKEDFSRQDASLLQMKNAVEVD